MAEYLMYDKDKAAFINRMNKLLGQVGPGMELKSSNFLDVPGSSTSEDTTVFVTNDPIVIKLLDTLIDKNAFTYSIKRIDLKEMIRVSREEA